MLIGSKHIESLCPTLDVPQHRGSESPAQSDAGDTEGPPRAGPTKDHEVAWVYNRAALPVEVTAEFENWRRIRDWEGAEGWVYHSLLSGKRTALVAPQSRKKDELLELRDKPDAASAISAKLQHGVLANVRRCKDGWCRLVGDCCQAGASIGRPAAWAASSRRLS